MKPLTVVQPDEFARWRLTHPPMAGAEEAEGGEGQGDQENPGSGLYDLESAPEQYRPFIEAELKKIEGNVTKRFQDAKDFRSQWEPYSAIEGLTDIPPEQVQELVQLRQIAQDPEAFDHWLSTMAEERGLLNGNQPDELEDEDSEDGDDVDLEALLDQRLQAALGPIMEQLQQTQQHQQQAQQEQTIERELERANSELDAVAQKAGVELDDDERTAVMSLAYPFADEDPDNAITRGFEAFQKIQGGGARKLVTDKATQPGGHVEGGSPHSTPTEVTIDNVKQLALERMRAAR